MKYLFLFSTLLIIVSCKSAKPVQESAEKDPAGYERFVIGWGGGFAGTYDEYHVYRNGMVKWKDINTGNFTDLKNLEKDDVQNIFESLQRLEPEKISLNDPGNMSYYLQIPRGVKVHRIAWGGGNSLVPEDLEKFFSETKEILPKKE